MRARVDVDTSSTSSVGNGSDAERREWTIRSITRRPVPSARALDAIAAGDTRRAPGEIMTPSPLAAAYASADVASSTFPHEPP
jgi:hypothetical protein